jgi:hypothetical protein
LSKHKLTKINVNGTNYFKAGEICEVGGKLLKIVDVHLDSYCLMVKKVGVFGQIYYHSKGFIRKVIMPFKSFVNRVIMPYMDRLLHRDD